MKKKTNNMIPYVFLLFFIIGCLVLVNIKGSVVNELTASEFITHLENSEIKELKIITKVRTENYEVTGKLNNYKENESFILYCSTNEMSTCN